MRRQDFIRHHRPQWGRSHFEIASEFLRPNFINVSDLKKKTSLLLVQTAFFLLGFEQGKKNQRQILRNIS